VSKGKLLKFAEMETFPNVLQPAFNEVFNKEFYLRGRWSSNFFGNTYPLILELGCGKGEYTVGLASLYPERNFLGVDIKGARIWKGAKAALEKKLKNAGFLRTRIDFINSFFAGSEVDEIWITFPDPQPRKYKKRLTSSLFLTRYREFLKPGGLVHLKTDDASLFEYTLKMAYHNHLVIDFATDDLYSSEWDNKILSIQTYYEAMWIKAGLKIRYIRFQLPNRGILTEPPDEEG
jgi:tRNA (guanine-N7-)-methyltransferase